MTDHHEHTLSNPLYWFVWLVSFAISHAHGIVKYVAEIIPKELDIPIHEVRYLPELRDLIPAVITACVCGLVSAIFVYGCRLGFRLFFKWWKTRNT